MNTPPADWLALWRQTLQILPQQLAPGEQAPLQIPDPKAVQQAMSSWLQAACANPAPLWQEYGRWAAQLAKLWLEGGARPPGQAAEPRPAGNDKRFKDEGWSNNPIFDFVRQAYLLTSEYAQRSSGRVQGLDAHTQAQVAFYLRQWLDAAAPSNFLLSNPQALRAAQDSGSETLRRGWQSLLDDLARSPGQLMPKMTDDSAFELGVNIATTPGKVVYRTALMELLQYQPSTTQVWQRPLLIVPPWINKYYILDLKEKNSLIKWLVDQGYTVFVISWINPDASLAHKGFDDYLQEGALAAIDAVREISGEKEILAAGYCIGGTLLACTLAWLAAKRQKRVRAASFFTTLLDFGEIGELGVFIDEQQIGAIEQHMQKKGYLEGREMAQVFNLLRDNDLIWSFYVNNYLLGKAPLPFDLLYWNSDSTRMPATMHGFYLRNMYLENRLRQPGGMMLAGVAIDLGAIKTPAYFISTREDHIAPWRATYAGARLLGGPVRFVLGGSGHIAGIVNPPSAHKYGYHTASELADSAESWLARSEAHDGSWWLDWQPWLAAHHGEPVLARQPGTAGLPILADAPGSYVKMR